MSINQIISNISEIPQAGKRGVDIKDIFVQKQEQFQDKLSNSTVGELNNLADSLNTFRSEVNSSTNSMNSVLNTVQSQAVDGGFSQAVINSKNALQNKTQFNASGYTSKPKDFIETDTPNTTIDPSKEPLNVNGRLVEVVGEELIVDGDFNTPNSWSGWVILNGNATKGGGTSLYLTPTTPVSIGVGKTFIIKYEKIADAGSLILANINGNVSLPSTKGIHEYILTITSGGDFKIYSTNNSSSIGSISVKEIQPIVLPNSIYDNDTSRIETSLVTTGSVNKGDFVVVEVIQSKLQNAGTLNYVLIDSTADFNIGDKVTVTTVTNGAYTDIITNIDINVAFTFGSTRTVIAEVYTITPFNDTYQAVVDTISGSSLTDTSKFQVVTDGISRQDIAVNKIDKVSYTRTVETFKGIKKFTAEEIVLKTPVMDFYYGVSDSNGLWSDADYWYLPIGAFTRFNVGAYHAFLNSFGKGETGIRAGLDQGWISAYDVINTVPITTYNKLITDSEMLDLRLEANSKPNFDVLTSVVNECENGSFDGIEGMVETLMFIGADASGKTILPISVQELVGINYTPINNTKISVLWDGFISCIGIDNGIPNTLAIYSFGNQIYIDNTNKYTGDKLYITYKSNNLLKGEMPHIDLIGTSNSYLQNLKDILSSGESVNINPLLVDDNGNSLIPDGAITTFKLNKKANLVSQILQSTDNGATWVVVTPTINYTSNTITFSSAPVVSTTILVSYSAKTSFGVKNQPTDTKMVLNKVFASNSHSIHKGGNAVYSGAGLVPTGDAYEQKVLEDVGIGFTWYNDGNTTAVMVRTGDIIFNEFGGSSGIKGNYYMRSGGDLSESLTTRPYAASSYFDMGKYMPIASTPTHKTLLQNTTVNSKGSKRIYVSSVADNGLDCVDMYTVELKYNSATNTYDGDNDEFTQLADGTFIDTNGEAIITSKITIPLNHFYKEI